MDTVSLALCYGVRNLMCNLVLLLFDRLDERALQTQAVVAGIDDQPARGLVFSDHVGIIIKAQQDDLLGSLCLLCLPFMRGIPITEAQIIVLALGACDHHKADFGVLGQLYTAVRAGLGGGLALQVKYSWGQQRRAHQLIQNIVQIFGAVFRLEGCNGFLDFRVENGCFRVFLFRHGFVPHFNFIALMASRR